MIGMFKIEGKMTMDEAKATRLSVTTVPRCGGLAGEMDKRSRI